MEIAPTARPAQQQIVFGVYRDGDNNLDASQERNVTDFIKTTAANNALKVVAEDTTSVSQTPFLPGTLRTESSIIENGHRHIVRVQSPVDMSDRRTLADFVRRTLEEKQNDPAFRKANVWVDLVDHGGGDGGGLQSQSCGGCMSMQDIAGAIQDGRTQFHSEHPTADDTVTGVVANQCLMATLGFADALSHSGVRYLAASPETMLSPGVPSAKVADELTSAGQKWPEAVVNATMHARYGASDLYHPAAAFDVLDLSPRKIASLRTAITRFNDVVDKARHCDDGATTVREIRSDLKSVRGMVRFDRSHDMPWHADRPAEAAYEKIASDSRLSDDVRRAARDSYDAVADLVLAHAEASDFGPFHASYKDAIGPTQHLPVTSKSYDSWAQGGISETHNDFYNATHGREFARAIGAYSRAEDAAGAVA